ncbi:MAG: Rossmann-like and DUF2520 domain-containing protein [Bacteroidota bacterium]
MKIVLLGAGNLATNLANTLYQHQHSIVQVYSRTKENASRLAEVVHAQPINAIQELYEQADLYILALKDDALRGIIPHLPDVSGIFVHTAGSVPMNIFEGTIKNYGVFYPLQTFNKNRIIGFSEIPIFIEANSSESYKVIETLACQISSEIHPAGTDDRLAIHVAAVFACNFTNFMFVGADEILRKHNLSFKSLKPLIQETIAKTQQHSPSEIQTGPAVRKDNQTIQTHLKILSDSGMWQKLYRFVSDMIVEYYNADHEK